jgi:Fic family protein
MAEPLDHLLQFLNESNALDDASEKVDAGDHDHVSLLSDVLDMARRREPVAVADLVQWHSRILREPEVASVPQSLREMLQRLNAELARLERLAPAADVARSLADHLYTFHAIHAFPRSNGRVGRLLAGYIAAWAGVPILVFRRAERDDLSKGIQDKLAMRCYVAAKLREAIFDRSGNLMRRTEAYGSADRYRGQDGASSVLMEWHDLLDAVDEWRRQGV